MGKIKIDKKIFRSKILALSLIYSFLLLITSEATPYKVDSDSNKEFKPVVRVKEAGEEIPTAQKDRFERLLEEGKKLFREEMDPEGAIKKFKEAQALAIARGQKAEVCFYLSLVYYATLGGEAEEFVESINQLIEADYYRELDKRLCPPKYRELFQGIKKEYGVLKVQSKPAGADVYLNDSDVPEGKTPLTIGSKAGSVKIRVKKGKKEKKEILSVIAGKETASSVLILKGGSSLLLVLGGIALAGGGAAALLSAKKGNGGGNGGIPAPTTGSIQVNSTPTGAQVYLDGADTGRTTDTTLTEVSPGSHTVQLIKEGYEDYEESVSVTAGQTTPVNANLTQHTITVTNPTSGTVWTKGHQVEITWETSGSATFKAYASPTTELNPLSYPGSNLSSSFQRRAFRHNPAFRGLSRTRRGSESSGLSKNEETILNISSKFQDVQKKSSSNGKVRNIIHPRTKNIGIIENNRSSSDTNLPLSPGTPYISSRHFPQTLKPSGNIRALTLTNVKIELYKGTSLVQTIASGTENVGSYTWIVDSSLEDGSDYKVKISCASALEVYGESDAFTVEGKSITITEPTSSTVWSQGDSVDIIWTSKGVISNVKIDLYKGSILKATIVSSTDNNGIFTWTEVDQSLEDSSDYKVRVSDAGESAIYAESDEFKIEKRSITVTEPTSSNVWTQGQSADIIWTSTGAISDVKIDLYKGGTLKEIIASSTKDDGTHIWTEVDPTLPDGSDYKVRVSCVSDSSVYDESDEFRIEQKSITVTEPTGGTSWRKGNSADITWTSTGAISDVKIDLYKGITLEQTIVSSTENDGTFTWTEVDPLLADGADYKVRIIDSSGTGIYGESDEFAIEEISITVTEPASDTIWKQGNSANITWISKGAINNVKIDLYKGTTLEITIATSTANDGNHTWTVDSSLPNGSDYKVRISSTSESSIYGDSDEFRIQEGYITVTFPPSGFIWAKGNSLGIIWTSEGTISDVKIDLYKAGSFEKNIAPSTANDGSYPWAPDWSLQDGSDYRIRISSTSDTDIYGESDEFRIEQKSFTITSPSSSTVWVKGYSADITWTSEGTINNAKIDLYKGSNLIFIKTIVSSTPNDGSYTWPEVDQSLQEGIDYKIRMEDADSGVTYGQSAEFKITEKPIAITEPTSNTVWVKGYPADITWNSYRTISSVRIDLYKGGALNQTIASSTENDGTYTWTEVDPSLLTDSDYKVRISDASDSSIYAESSEFLIFRRYIWITEPTGSTVWSQGHPADIIWTSKGPIDNVKIELHKGTTLKETIVLNTINDGLYTWTVNPTLPDGTDYKIKISTVDDTFWTVGVEFKIEKKSITVTKPTSSTIWAPGYPADITWTSEGAIDNVKIDLYKGTTLEITIATSTANDGNHTWTEVVPSLPDGTDYKVRISAVSDTSVYGESDEFQIAASYEFLTEWGSSGNGDGQFTFPTGIAVDISGYVYVADTNISYRDSSRCKWLCLCGYSPS